MNKIHIEIWIFATLVKYLNSRMLKVQVEEEEEVAVCLHEKLKKTSLTVASLEAALNMKASETREMEAKNAGEHWTCAALWCWKVRLKTRTAKLQF